MRLHSIGRPSSSFDPILGRVTTAPLDDLEARGDHIVLVTEDTLPRFEGDFEGYAGALSPDSPEEDIPSDLPSVWEVGSLDYLGDGDVVQLQPSGTVAVFFRSGSLHNTLLTTERCNSYCLMCSQPPKEKDERHRAADILRAIELIEPWCPAMGLSGGEPTLLGDDFLRIISKFKEFLPLTGLHVLTNGRRFEDRAFAHALGDIRHPDLMLGIPLYSDIDSDHDYVVQARGAFEQTMNGLYNLAEAGVLLEIRVVLHAQTYRRLPRLAQFIAENLPFASHVALMGLEMFGFVHKNFSDLWIDPVDYQPQLTAAIRTLALSGMNVSIYNHQLCTLPEELWPFTCKSISDWKNVYLEECSECGMREFCGGFFHSATKKHSEHIQPLPMPSPAEERQLRHHLNLP